MRGESPDASRPLRAYVAMGDYGRALSHAKSVLRRRGPDRRWLEAAIRCAHAAGETEEALQLLRRLVSCAPEDPAAQHELGFALWKLGRWPEAEQAMRRGLAMEPTSPAALSNLANLLASSGNAAEAEPLLRQAIRSSDDPLLRYNLGLVLLAKNEFEEGWERFEARCDARLPGNAHAVAGALPRWDEGAAPHGSVLVLAEQGLGDAIQFARFLPHLKARGATRVGFACDARLHALLQGLPGVDVLTTRDAARPGGWDAWMPLLSLPRWLKTRPDTIPSDLPYLHAPESRVAQWSARLPPARLRVGLAWKGSPEHANDNQRSLPGLDALRPLWQARDVAFISLQKGAGEHDAPANQPICRLGPELRDFADTAAVVESLDLVISVDTAVAHLAGALGRRTWVLLPARGLDWRWPRHRADSDWYPGALRLFHREGERWDTCIAELARALVHEAEAA